MLCGQAQTSQVYSKCVKVWPTGVIVSDLASETIFNALVF